MRRKMKKRFYGIEIPSMGRLKARTPFNAHNAGFGLLDTALALAVAGCLTVAVLKGYHLVESARLMSIATQADHLRMAIQISDEPLPNDDQAHVKKLWETLTQRNLIGILMQEGYPVSKMG
ncbi:MAG: hypothetical protein LBQ26_00895, partial [Holosporales bacterium]|nr:hypothetical protein [Holosporales bacterium]